MKANTASVPVSKPSNDDLVILHEPLVKRIAFHLMNRLPPSVQAEPALRITAWPEPVALKPRYTPPVCAAPPSSADRETMAATGLLLPDIWLSGVLM